MHNNESWILINVYGPCTAEGKRSFIEWFKQIQMLVEIDWLIVGDFNLMRKQEDRNKEGVILLRYSCSMMPSVHWV